MKQDVKCPYNVSGICYRKGCIYRPHLKCMTKREYDRRLTIARKISKRNKTLIKRFESVE